MAISLQRFIDKTNLTEVDVPWKVGTISLKGECVSLVQQYVHQCFDLPLKPRGDAWNYGDYLIREGVAKKVTKPRYGDIIVWGQPYGLINGKYYGHVAIYIDHNLIFDQNNGWITPVRSSQHRPMLPAKPLQYIRMNKDLITDKKPNYDKELDKYSVGDYVEFSVKYESHHMDPVRAYGSKEKPLKGYVIHKYPKDKHQLALADTPGGEQTGATNPENVWVRKDGDKKPVEKPKPKPTPKPSNDLYEGKFEVGQYIEFSTLHESHHMDPVIKRGRQKAYIVHIYPKDKHPLSLSATKGGKPIGATNTVNVYSILKKP